MSIRKLHLDLHWFDGKAKGNGSVDLIVAGATENGVSHHVVVNMGPDALSSLAWDLHKVVKDMQERLDRVKKSLRGE